MCHGLAGLIDVFIDADQRSDDRFWWEQATCAGEVMINDARRPTGW
jgi:hypothetical protein